MATGQQGDRSGRVLIVEDDADLRELLDTGLSALGYETTARESAEAAIELIETTDYDVVLTDVKLPGMSGLDFCARIVADRRDVTVIVMTAFANLQTAVAAIRAGAHDFILKPLDLDAVGIRVRRGVEERELRDEVKRLREAVGTRGPIKGLVGTSPAMAKVYDLLERVGGGDTTVLITGESGTGKEVVARALHNRSGRAQGAFVAVNCSAIPEQLLESELFGHAKGAFTNAHQRRVGLFAEADGGTLFLDEIGEIPLHVQPKLLRALEERVVRPVGAEREDKIDVRIIAATNRDLEGAVDEGRFREDLFFRINVIHVHMPPLRARGADVLALAQHFLRHYAAQSEQEVSGFSAEAGRRLLAYEWPGNVRELRNCIERAVALTRGHEIAVSDLPDKIREFSRSHVVVASDDPGELPPLEEVERRYIFRVLDATSGNKTTAARILGLDRKTLYRKLERYQRMSESSDS